MNFAPIRSIGGKTIHGNTVKLVFDIDELRYYFDAEQRDSIDRGSISRKSGEFWL